MMPMSALSGVLALACATLAHAATVTVPASAFHFCINIHDQDAPQAVSAMKAAGFGCYRKDATGAPLESALAAAGFKGDFIVTDGPAPDQQMAKVAALASAHRGSVEFVESRNEVNNRATVYGGYTDTTGANQSERRGILAYDAALVATVRGFPQLAGVPVLAHTDLHATPSSTDYANAHGYDPNNSWGLASYWMPQIAAEMTKAMPGKPQAVTEFGLTKATRAPYVLPQAVAQLLLSGVNVAYAYELRDAPGDPYGLYTADWTPKPAVAVMAKLNGLLKSVGSAAAKPLGVTVSDTGVASLLIDKGDGSYVHMLWRPWPDGKVHPFTWSYSRSAKIQALMLASLASTAIWPDLTWSKAAGQPSDWSSYTDGVVMVSVRPEEAGPGEQPLPGPGAPPTRLGLTPPHPES